MKRRKNWLVCLSVAAMAASPAVADMTVTMSRGPGSGPGGEFYATHSGFDQTPVSLGGLLGAFETFCVEKNEYINFTSTYYVQFNSFADAGGISGGNPDPLDSRTAYLYEQFITGQLTGYNYNNMSLREDSADALQDIIWYLEDEQAWDASWVAGTLQHTFFTDAESNHTGSIGNVQIMNMYRHSNFTGRAQDQLVYFAEPIPAPGAACLAMIGLAMVRRKKRLA